jgi:hypothetical protein
LIKVLENEEQEPMVRHEAGIYFLSDARMKVTVLLLLYISRNPGHFARPDFPINVTVVFMNI